MKKTFAKILSSVMAVLILFSLSVMPTVSADSYKKPTKVTAISKKTISVKKGRQFELKVFANGDDDYLRWSIIKGKNIVKFDDYDRYDDEVEFIAKKKGTAKVKCYIKGTKKSVVFTVKVTNVKKTNYISATKARNIALNHAGVKLSKVRDLSVEKDNEYGKVIYEVDFEAGRYEYSYDINAKTGKIIYSNKEYED